MARALSLPVSRAQVRHEASIRPHRGMHRASNRSVPASGGASGHVSACGCGSSTSRRRCRPDRAAIVVDYNRVPGVQPATARFRLRGLLRPDLRAGRSAARWIRALLVDYHPGRPGTKAVRRVARLQRARLRNTHKSPEPPNGVGASLVGYSLGAGQFSISVLPRPGLRRDSAGAFYCLGACAYVT